MDKEYTREWHIQRNRCYLEWATWLGCPMWFDGGVYVNRTPEEHRWSSIYFR